MASPGQMIAAVIRNLPEKTGRTLEEWVALVQGAGLASRREQMAWLKETHGVGHVTASIIVEEASGEGENRIYEDGDALVDAMYAGDNAPLRPLYENTLKLAMKLGNDVTVTPCKTYVGLRRRRQFATIKPGTRSRLVVGLALGDTEPAGRLEKAPRGGEPITHRIFLTSLAEIDDELKQWLSEAYENGR